MPLTAPRFVTNARLQAAAANSPPLKQGDRGSAVWLVQQALIDLGYSMPVSVKKNLGSPDGIFGGETLAAVRAFQSACKLSPDGIAGKNTLAQLDLRLAGQPPVGVRYDVPLIPQNHKMGCWAAGISMLIGWKDGKSVTPLTVARRCAHESQLETGLDAEDHGPLDTWGLEVAPAQTYTVQGFYNLLEVRGPLWVAAKVGGAHIRVVTGIHVGTTAGDTVVFINDPWEVGMATFRSSNRGSAYAETYLTYESRQRTLAYEELQQYPAGIYVAHWPGRKGNPCGGGPS